MSLDIDVDFMYYAVRAAWAPGISTGKVGRKFRNMSSSSGPASVPLPEPAFTIQEIFQDLASS